MDILGLGVTMSDSLALRQTRRGSGSNIRSYEACRQEVAIMEKRAKARNLAVMIAVAAIVGTAVYALTAQIGRAHV
mgnify:CR=1 FL=1